MQATSGENLKREITSFSLGMAIVNVVVGSGIFVLPAIISQGIGATAILAYFVCAIIMLCVGLCMAQLGSITTKSGGCYTYIESAFGRYPGFLANNLSLFGSCVVSDAAISNALADTLAHFFPQLQSGIVRTFFMLLVFGILAFINIRSVKYGVRFVVLTGFGKLIPLLVLVVVGAQFVQPENLAWVTAPTFTNISAAALLLYFAFVGIEVPLSNGGEMKNPHRTVPYGVLIGVAIVSTLYIAIQIISQGVLGNDLPANTAPLATVAGKIVGNYGHVIVLGVMAVSMLGALGGEILSNPRNLFAGARDGLMPKVFAKVHPKFSTPYLAIAMYAFAGFILSVSAGFKQLAIISTASVLMVYLGVILAAVKVKLQGNKTNEKVFRLPFGIIIPIIAFAAIVWLLTSLASTEIIGLIIFLAALSIIYWAVFMNKKKVYSNG